MTPNPSQAHGAASPGKGGSDAVYLLGPELILKAIPNACIIKGGGVAALMPPVPTPISTGPWPRLPAISCSERRGKATENP